MRWRPTRCGPLLLCALLALAVPLHAAAGEPSRALGVSAAQLRPGYWIGKLERPDAVLLDAAAIAARNARLQRLEPSYHDLDRLPPTLEAEQVRRWIEAISVRPRRTLYDEDGKPGSERQIDRLVAALDLDGIPRTQLTRYGLIVRRTSLRTFPTHLRVFSAPGDTDIDRFQESALFPGTPVVIAHASRDRKWWFVVSPFYAAWVEASAVAEGSRNEVLDYGRRTPFALVTGAGARTVFNPEQPALSELALDMGVRVPVLASWPPDRPVHGQLAASAHVVELPLRGDAGRLQFAPALLPASADIAMRPLPLTPANVLRQAFKFLGERYGWGHDYNGRDCSGFVAEVYRSFGVLMPRNTGDQARSPAFERTAFDDATPRGRRLEAVRTLRVGDLVYIPGHVMLVIGFERGEPWVIHDVAGVNVRGADGRLRRVPLNAVSVTPLLPLQANDTTSFVDSIDSVVRMRRAP